MFPWTPKIGFLSCNHFFPVHQPLFSWAPPIDFLDPNKLLLGPQPLITWIPHIDFRSTKEWSPGLQTYTSSITRDSGSKKTFHVVGDVEIDGLALLDICKARISIVLNVAIW